MRRLLVCLTALACLLLSFPASASALQHVHRAPEPPPPPGPTTTPAPPPPPKAWILIDADTGAVLDQGNAHQPLPPASVTKVLTALIAVEQIQPGADIPISAEAQGIDCGVGGPNNNIVSFTDFFVPNPSAEIWTLEGDYVDTGFFLQFLPPDFIPTSPGGFTQDTASIRSFFVNGRPVPEPASLGLMLSGLFGLGWARKRKAHAENL